MDNKNFGKTIKIFLIDGNPNGRMTCELSNWTGKAYKIPRMEVKNCGDRADLNNTGVYLLFGKNEEGKDAVYIGEAEDVLVRLNQHLSQKDFWNEVIVLTSKDENLNKAHIKYLENRLVEIAKECDRYVLENGNTPTQSSISELDRAEMEEFIVNAKLLVNTLGHKVFERRPEASLSKNKTLFYLEIGKEDGRFCKGIGEQNAEGFLVLKGSKIAEHIVPSLQKSFQQLRDNLIAEGKIIDYVFQEDYQFSSPSTAGSIIAGRSTNGLTYWKTKDGKMLKDYNL